ncbi:hypothetical protein ACTQ33_01985 [Candidatus Avoscillospira sp. LCP25S3_F1]|uniref:hypothetical protein n=1 Tax=Candidatus Avoscillospira sp. LCP25S3_F1 TaxID=3438825 RepID=UPI003F927DA0
MGMRRFNYEKKISIMLNDESVLKLFEDYLRDNQDIEVVQTSHEKSLMLWDNAAKNWCEVVCCPTPESLFEKLLESACCYKEDFNSKDQQQIARIRVYLRRKEELL